VIVKVNLGLRNNFRQRRKKVVDRDRASLWGSILESFPRHAVEDQGTQWWESVIKGGKKGGASQKTGEETARGGEAQKN